MRIRSTKPEYWRSERIASVSWDARLVLKGLESYVDDNGVGKDDLALIVGDLFQRDLVREPSRTLARVTEALSELNSAGLLHRYEAEGTSLLFVAFWETFQRVDKPQPGRMPRPDGTFNYKDSAIRESVANPREPSRNLAPVTGEQGNRGTGEQSSLSNDKSSDRVKTVYPEDFEAWWKSYPRRESKGDALKAWKTLQKERILPPVEELIAAAEAYGRRETRPEFRKLPGGWLRDHKWGDEKTAPHQPGSTTPTKKRFVAGVYENED